ncbi:MAG: hypothetical protein ABMA64_17940 [Myxococcota bacterium]
MWWFAAAEASQLAVDRYRDGLIVVTTWHLHPEVWWVAAPGVAPEQHGVDQVATDPTVACGRRGCDVGWLQLRPELEPPDRWPGASWARFDRRGLGPPEPLALPAGPPEAAEPRPGWRVVDDLVFAPTDRGTDVYVQTLTPGPQNVFAVDRAPLSRGALGAPERLSTSRAPGLFAADGGVWWRTDTGALAGTGTPRDGLLVDVVDGDHVAPLEHQRSERFATLSPAGDAAVWADPDGGLHAAWLIDGRITDEVVLEKVDPHRAAHAWMQGFVEATVPSRPPGLAPLAIPVQITRVYTGSLSVTLGERVLPFELVDRDPTELGPGQAALRSAASRDDELAPEEWRMDQLSAVVPPDVFPEGCGPVPDDLRLELTADADGWSVGVTRRGALDVRLSGRLDGPRAAPGEAELTGAATGCGVEVPVRVRWTVTAPAVREWLQPPHAIGGPF